MPKSKSKRTAKHYRPREVFIDPLTLGLLHPKGSTKRVETDLANELYLQKLIDGTWRKDELGYLSSWLKFGAVLTQCAQEQSKLLEDLRIAKIALELIANFIDPEKTPPNFLLDPIKAASVIIADLQEISSATEQSRAWQLAQIKAGSLLDFDGDRVHLVAQESPQTYQQILKKPAEAFLHGRVVHGCVFLDDQKRLAFDAKSDGVSILIEEPTIVYCDAKQNR